MHLLISLLSSSVVLCVPVLVAALGELVNERAGVLNVGLEGVMLSGAFASALAYRKTENLAVGLVAAIAAGLVCWLVLGALYLWRQTEQIVTGLLFNLLILGLTATLFSKFVSDVGTVHNLPKITFGPLTRIPFFGPILFDQTIFVYLSLLIVGVIHLVLNRTWFGLRLRAVGEMPEVAFQNGINVMGLRWIALGFGCVLGAAGGGILVLSQSGIFLPGVTSGAGFIALAVVVVGRFSAPGILIAAYGFGVATSLQFYSENIFGTSPGVRYFWVAFPFLATLVALSVWKRARYPAAIGKRFEY